MERKLDSLAEHLSERDCEGFEPAFESFAANASITEEEKQRILSSVMRKAGLEMKETIPNKRKIKITKGRPETAPYPEAARLRRGSFAAAAAAIVLVAALAAVLVLGNGLAIDEPPDIPAAVQQDDKAAIPDVVGLDKESARQVLTDAGFTPVERSIYNDETPEGSVVKTDPEAGTECAEQTEVQYFVSQGPMPQPVEVPDVVGMSVDSAAALLNESGLGYDVRTVDQPGDADVVLEQSYEAGSRVDSGTVVTLWLPASGEGELLALDILLPENIRGSYTLDVYRDGSIAYTKTIQNAETLADGKVTIMVSGKGRETLLVYISSNDLAEDNYIRYATFEVDYENAAVEVVGEYNEADLEMIIPSE